MKEHLAEMRRNIVIMRVKGYGEQWECLRGSDELLSQALSTQLAIAEGALTTAEALIGRMEGEV